jgi:hypothetical protein
MALRAAARSPNGAETDLLLLEHEDAVHAVERAELTATQVWSLQRAWGDTLHHRHQVATALIG